MHIRCLVTLFALSALLFGCPSGDDDDTTGDDDVSDDDDDATDDDDDGDISTSCADAPDLPMNGDWTESVLEAPDDEDFFLLTVDEDTFVDIWTGFYDDNVGGQLDPVISLYDADGATLLATADDQIPRVNTDSELRYHAFAGSYCVKIEGWEHWAGETASQETTDWSYALNALEMDPALPDTWYEGVLNPDTEPNDNVAQAQAATLYDGSGSSYATVYGVLDSAADVDVYAFTTSAEGAHLNVYFYRPTGPGGAGVQGHGTTLELGEIDISDPGGNVIGRVDGALEITALSLPFQGQQEILLWVQAADGWTPGDNDFYVIDVANYHSSNPLEADEAGNGTPAQAETATFSNGSAFLAGYLPSAADVDFWAFEASADQVLSLACGALRNGSGVVDATFTVQAEDGTVLQSETELPTADVLWSDSPYADASMPALQIGSDDTYYLRVSSAGGLPDVSDRSYLCGIHDATP